MRRIPLLILCQVGLLFADDLTLKDGRRISGSVESGNVVEIRVKTGDQTQTIDIHDVQTIQFSSPLPVSKAADSSAAQPNTLILKDGTQIGGKWWAIDAGNLHFLVDNQLRHYPRGDLAGVTFGGATLTAPREHPAPPPPASAPQAANSPTSERPAGTSRPSAAPRVLSQPEEIGAVYYWNGKGLIPLEARQAVARKSGSTEYWEIPGAQSGIRLPEAETLIFILRLPKGSSPAGYSLVALDTVDGNRRTRSRPGRKGGLLTWPVDIKVNNESSLMTYALSVRDLPAGEYSFSPSDSNDAYCFGVDPAAPGQ